MIMKQTGLTLIELVVTLAVISILLVMGIPQFKSTTANSRLTTTINTLTGDLAFARTEAIKRGEAVTVTVNNNSDWATGWKVEVLNDSEDLRISPALSANVALNASGVTSIQFNANGRSTATATFKLCDDRTGAFGKTIDLTTTGQTFLEVKKTCP